MSYEGELLRQGGAVRMVQMGLQSVHQGHPIHSSMQHPRFIQNQHLCAIARSSPSSSSFSLSHELSRELRREIDIQYNKPPRQQQHQQLALPQAPPMPVASRVASSYDGVNVPVPTSPITIASSIVSRVSVHASSPESPLTVHSSVPEQRTSRARPSSRKGAQPETNVPEGSHRGDRKTRSGKGVKRGACNK